MWETKIIEKYPKTFRVLGYFECNEGWKELIDEVSAKIEAVNNKYPESSYINAVQVKQKFGGLRYYVSIEEIDSHDVDYIYGIIEQAEKRSISICEFCGAPAKVSKWGYNIETACDEHSTTGRRFSMDK